MLRRWRSPPDGSCFFHSIARQTGQTAKSLRERCAMDTLRRQDNVLNGLPLKKWIDYEYNETPEQYASEMRRGRWAGVLEMKLLADYFNRPVVVYAHLQTGHAKRVLIVEPEQPEAHSCARPLFLLYVSGNHYDALELPKMR